MRHLFTAALLLSGCKSDDPVDTATEPFTPVSCPDARDARFDDLAAQVEAERKSLGLTGVSVAMMLDGELVWCEGFGAKDSSGEPPTGRTLFRMGSVNKMLTAAALLQEVDAGRLELQATLPSLLGADWQLARQPGLTDTLTVHHLLTHQGGFVDYLELSSRTPLVDWIDGFLLDNLYMMAEPGSFFNYSNPNFMVAGRVLEHTSGQKYLPRLTEELLLPLGMERTVFLPADVEADGDYAPGFVHQGGQLVEMDLYDNPWARPAGYAWTSAEELARFAALLVDGRPDLLSGEGLERMVSPHVDMLTIPGVEHYGYGVMVMEGMFLSDGYHAIDWLTHAGVLPGHTAELTVIPDQGFAFVTLANGNGGLLHESLDLAVESFVDLPPATDGPDMTPPDPQDYVGVYEDPWNVGTMIFALDEEDGLTVEMPLLDQLAIPYEPELQPMYGDTFILGVQGTSLPLTFVAGEDGAPRWARTRSFVGERTDPVTARTAPLHADDVDPDVLRARLVAPPPPPFRPRSAEVR